VAINAATLNEVFIGSVRNTPSYILDNRRYRFMVIHTNGNGRQYIHGLILLAK
jgi:hypothetical protein